MSLADELLADLEDEDDDEQNENGIDPDERNVSMEIKTEVKDDVSIHPEDIKMEVDQSNLKSVAKLDDSSELADVLSKIDHFSQTRKPQKACSSVPVESDPEYILIVDANNIAAEIDSEIGTVHKFAKNIYSRRFPELDTLIVNPLEYLMTAKELGNDLETAKNNKVLEQYLSQATIMVVSVTASTTQGSNLNSEDLRAVHEAYEVAMSLNEKKQKIIEYVESRMAFIAPNLSAVIGASIAAKLMGAAGGLTNLSKMPANHVSLLGQQKKSNTGFSQRITSSLPHTGFVFRSELVQSVPPDLRRKVSRVVGAKCTLAARVDSCHRGVDGEIGKQFRDEIVKKIDKFQEPPPVKATKALPTPIEAPKKRRGGRRVRKMKERYAVTELRKQANRMNFGELEEDVYQGDLGYSRGNIGKSGIGGGIRMAQIDERTKVRISQTLKRNLQKQQAYGGGATTVKKHISGTASSVAFTPLQGLEIVNPHAVEKASDEANAKYFSASASFRKIQTPAPKTT